MTDLEKQAEAVRKKSLQAGGYSTEQLIDALKNTPLTGEQLAELKKLVEVRYEDKISQLGDHELFTSEVDPK